MFVFCNYLASCSVVRSLTTALTVQSLSPTQQKSPETDVGTHKWSPFMAVSPQSGVLRSTRSPTSPTDFLQQKIRSHFLRHVLQDIHIETFEITTIQECKARNILDIGNKYVYLTQRIRKCFKRMITINFLIIHHQGLVGA